MADEYVTSGEFGRWREDFRSFQAQLNVRLTEGFGGVHERLDVLNGRTRRNEEGIASIRAGGCAQLVNHQAALNALADDGPVARWKKPAKVAGIGAAAVALFELVKSIVELVLQAWK